MCCEVDFEGVPVVCWKHCGEGKPAIVHVAGTIELAVVA